MSELITPASSFPQRASKREEGEREQRAAGMEMGDSFEYYWEMQHYLESEELRYATPDASARDAATAIGFGRESSDSIVRNLPSLQPLHGHPGRCPVLLRLQLAGWLLLQLVLGAGGRGGHGVREA